MKCAYTMSLILVTLMIVAGCSSEENTDYPGTNRAVRQSIKRPVSNADKKYDSEKVADVSAKEKSVNIKSQAEKSEGGVKQVKSEKQEGQYIVQKGDSLPEIANKDHIYNDSLRWPILYRENKETLDEYKKKPHFPEIELPPSMNLKFISDDDFKKNLRKQSRKNYVVNILSSPQMERLTPLAVKLVDNGFFTYITAIKVNEEDWYRLRVGFYRTRSNAKESGKKIKGLLKLSDIWAAEIEDDEFQEFGGY